MFRDCVDPVRWAPLLRLALKARSATPPGPRSREQRAKDNDFEVLLTVRCQVTKVKSQMLSGLKWVQKTSRRRQVDSLLYDFRFS